ncbi:hypothetical protein CCAN2_1890028 [Capnocytophaga canimorsus]|nr:hypothetical protein CCAN2_1890028 [Capnocytophaga canimorsus]
MIPKLEKKLQSIPVLGRLVSFLKKIRLGKHPFSLYDLIELYVVGIVEGAVTYRASAISYSFFVAIFPFLLFVLNLIPVRTYRRLSARFLDFFRWATPSRNQ